MEGLEIRFCPLLSGSALRSPSERRIPILPPARLLVHRRFQRGTEDKIAYGRWEDAEETFVDTTGVVDFGSLLVLIDQVQPSLQVTTRVFLDSVL